MSAQSSSPISAIIDGFIEGREEARRERQARQLHYSKRLIENFNYSPKEFYVLLAKSLEARQIPGLSAELVRLPESVLGSPLRLYMTIARERFVYYVCAAPFGSGFFFSWRLVDERMPGSWYHIVAALAAIGVSTSIVSIFITSPIIRLFSSMGFDFVALATILPLIPACLFLLQFLLLWSLMRCAAIPGYERLAMMLERTPIAGRVFERFFRPDTYYRHDSQEMFKEAFEHGLRETIESIASPKGARKRDIGSAAIDADLHGK